MMVTSSSMDSSSENNVSGEDKYNLPLQQNLTSPMLEDDYIEEDKTIE